MAYSVNLMTASGRGLVAAATAQNPITFTRIGSMTTSVTADDVDSITAALCDGVWGTIGNVASEGQTARIIGEFTNFGSGTTVKTVVFFAQSTTSDEIPFAVLSDQYADIYIPGTLSPATKILVAFTAAIADTVIKSTGSDTVTMVDFLGMKGRTVTTHAENDATTGDNQTILGVKTFQYRVKLGDSGAQFAGTNVRVQSVGQNNFHVIREGATNVIVGSVGKTEYQTILTADSESGLYGGKPLREFSASDYSLDGEAIKWGKCTLFGGDTRDAPDAFVEGGEVTAQGAFVDIGRRDDDDRATINSWSGSERHVIEETSGTFSVEFSENSSAFKKEVFKVDKDGAVVNADTAHVVMDSAGLQSQTQSSDDGWYTFNHSSGGIVMNSFSSTTSQSLSSMVFDSSGFVLSGVHEGGDAVALSVADGLASLSSVIDGNTTTQMKVNHGVLTLPSGIGNLKDVLLNLGAAGADGLTLLWVDIYAPSDNTGVYYAPGSEISTISGQIELYNAPHTVAGIPPISSLRKYILLSGLRVAASASGIVSQMALAIRSN